jgi:GNAT superfamily N-acetyltransferase
MQVVELDPEDPTLAEVLPVLAELRPHLDLDTFREVYAEGWSQGLRFSALFDEDQCVAVAGWRVIACTSSLRKLYVDDLVTAAAFRSAGHGRMLLSHLHRIAATEGCSVLDLDSGTQRVDAHRFYEREGLDVTALHFAQSVAPQPAEPLHPERVDEARHPG